jgi:hypothetical protein
MRTTVIQGDDPAPIENDQDGPMPATDHEPAPRRKFLERTRQDKILACAVPRHVPALMSRSV